MKSRPWPVIILAFLHIIAPLLNISVSAYLLGIKPDYYIYLLFKNDTWPALLLFLVPMPIAGLAIFMVKEWSYPVFLAVYGWTFYSIFLNWQQFPGVISLPTLISIFLVNIGIVSYFLIPAVRAAYFDKRLRWWESKRRFRVNIVGTLGLENSPRKILVTNISEGGVFVKSKITLKMGEVLRLSFSILSQKYILNAKVVHCQIRGVKGDGYGIQFLHTNQTLSQMKNLSMALQLIGLGNRLGASHSWFHDFKDWIIPLLKTGRGWIPEVQKPGLISPVLTHKVKKKPSFPKRHLKKTALKRVA